MIAILLVFVLVLIIGAIVLAGDKSCAATTDCAEGFSCSSNVCIASCTSNSCPTGYVCINGICQKLECSADSDCNSFEICDMEENKCKTGPECTADVDCEGDLVCRSSACKPKPECEEDNPCTTPNTNCILGKCIQQECNDTKPCAAKGRVCVDNACMLPENCSAADVSCPTGYSCTDNTCVLDAICADGDCAQGFQCVDGSCVQRTTCVNTPDCVPGYECDSGKCVDKTGTAASRERPIFPDVFGSCQDTVKCADYRGTHAATIYGQECALWADVYDTVKADPDTYVDAGVDTNEIGMGMDVARWVPVGRGTSSVEENKALINNYCRSASYTPGASDPSSKTKPYCFVKNEESGKYESFYCPIKPYPACFRKQ